MSRWTARLDRFLDAARVYTEGLTTDQLETYFWGLFLIGLLLSIYLLYSIYRRSPEYQRRLRPAEARPDSGPPGLAGLLRTRERAREEEEPKKKRSAWSFLNP